MSEMIERVAMALRRADFDSNLWTQTEIEGELSKPFAPIHLDRARAAIEAMREPTEEMIGAGQRAVELDTLGSPEDDARTAWKAGIDAALTPTPPSP